MTSQVSNIEQQLASCWSQQAVDHSKLLITASCWSHPSIWACPLFNVSGKKGSSQSCPRYQGPKKFRELLFSVTIMPRSVEKTTNPLFSFFFFSHWSHLSSFKEKKTCLILPHLELFLLLHLPLLNKKWCYWQIWDHCVLLYPRPVK